MCFFITGVAVRIFPADAPVHILKHLVRSTTDSEKKCAQNDREVLALIFGVKKFTEPSVAKNRS